MITLSFIALICLSIFVSVILTQIRQWFFFWLSLFIVFISLHLSCHFWGDFVILDELRTALRGWWKGEGWDFRGAWLPHNDDMVDLNEDVTKLTNEQCVERSRQLNIALTACLTQLGEDGRAARQRALHQEMLVIKSMEPADKPVQAGMSLDWTYTGPRPQYHVGGL